MDTEMRAQKVDPEEKDLPPLLPGLEPAIFRSTTDLSPGACKQTKRIETDPNTLLQHMSVAEMNTRDMVIHILYVVLYWAKVFYFDVPLVQTTQTDLKNCRVAVKVLHEVKEIVDSVETA